MVISYVMGTKPLLIRDFGTFSLKHFNHGGRESIGYVTADDAAKKPRTDMFVIVKTKYLRCSAVLGYKTLVFYSMPVLCVLAFDPYAPRQQILWVSKSSIINFG